MPYKVDDIQSDDIKTKATVGVGWSSAAQIINQVTQVIITIILARLLSPRDFGLVGMAMIFLNIVLPTNELGLGSAIVQSRDIKNIQLSTIFWISFFIGLISWLATFALAPVIAGFFDSMALRPVITMISFIFLMQSFGLVHNALLSRKLDFKAIAFANILGSAAYGLVSVTLALLAFQLWSLVLGTMARSLVYIIVVWRYCAWRPSFKFDLRSIRGLLSYGLSLWGSNLVTQISQNVDYLIVGKLLGASALGYYTIAFKLADLPRTKITSMISAVAFPAFSAIQDDNEKMKRGYLTISRYASMAVFPILIALLITADKVIPLVYGAKWTPSVLPFQILAVSGLVVCVSNASTTVFLAKGFTSLMFKLSVFYTVLLAIFALSGSSYGITGVSLAVLVSTTILAVPRLLISIKITHIKARDFLSAIYPSAVSSIAAGLVLVFFSASGLFTDNVIGLLSGLTIAVGIYIFTLRIIDRDGIVSLMQMVFRVMPKGIVSVIKKDA